MSKFFINRPIVAMVISILMVLLGLVAMSGLPIAQFPNIADPQIQVNATYPGADATTIEQSVAKDKTLTENFDELFRSALKIIR